MGNRFTCMFIALVGAALLVQAGCKGDKKSEKTPEKPVEPDKDPNAVKPDKPAGVTLAPAPPIPPVPKGLPAETPSPESNPTTPEKVVLGEMLFFDRRMSDKGAFSCATCHLPGKGWADGEVLSKKHDGNLNKRHSPTMFNVGYDSLFYWDGRKKTLEDQILAAWEGQVGATPDAIAKKLAAIPEYKAHFDRAFKGPPSKLNIPQALAAFLRIKLRNGDSPWDKFQAGKQDAVSEDAKKGWEIFTKKAGCAACHAPPLFKDSNFHNVGVGYKDVKEPDVGRGAVDKSNPQYIGAFKTPSLRGVSFNAPYFHDGSAETLEDAVDFMLAGGHRKGNKHIDPLLKPVKLTKDERAQLLAFIRTLSPDQLYNAPKLPK